MNDYTFSSYNEYFGEVEKTIISKKDIYKTIGIQNINENWNKFKEYHSKNNLLEYEFEEKINYQELINDYQKYYSSKEIIEKLLNEFNLSKQKVAGLMKTTRYYINKILEK